MVFLAIYIGVIIVLLSASATSLILKTTSCPELSWWTPSGLFGISVGLMLLGGALT